MRVPGFQLCGLQTCYKENYIRGQNVFGCLGEFVGAGFTCPGKQTWRVLVWMVRSLSG